MRKITLLFVITKLELGGAQKQLLSLARRLDKERFNLLLFTAREGLLMEEASSIAGLTVRRSGWLQRRVNPFKDLFALAELFLFMKKNRIDIVHTHSSKAGIIGRFAAALAGVKIVIHTVHGWSFNDYQPFFVRVFYIWLERLASLCTDRLIVVSEHDKRRGLRCGIGENSQYTLIRYGIDYGSFCIEDQAIKGELGIQENERVVTMISCLKPQKAPQDFIRLASLVGKALPRVKFVLVGDGSLRRMVEREADTYGVKDRVIMTGWRHDVPRILSATDVLVLTSLWEGLPIAVLEGIACGKPAVATDTGGIREVLKNGESGFLVSARDTGAMSEKLIALLKDRELCSSMGQKGRSALGEEFTSARMVTSTLHMYARLIEDKGGAYAH
jgi:glycosyltransferase involved in cell wall biosynthesis